ERGFASPATPQGLAVGLRHWWRTPGPFRRDHAPLGVAFWRRRGRSRAPSRGTRRALPLAAGGVRRSGRTGGTMSATQAARVREIMTSDVVTIGPKDDLRLAVQVMLWGGFRHLPVVEGDDLVGLVTEHDIHRVQGAALDPSV